MLTLLFRCEIKFFEMNFVLRSSRRKMCKKDIHIIVSKTVGSQSTGSFTHNFDERN
jgi:hypothetical protein